MSTGDSWHPVGLSHSIEAGSSAGTRLLGQELVVWRDTGGTAHVWEYDRAGYCQYIPAHPDLDVPKTFKVPVYLTQEQAGMVWTTLSGNPAPLPVDRDQTVPLRSLYLDCSTQAAITALGMVRLMPFVSRGLADTIVHHLTDTLYAVSTGDDRLLIGIQAISETRTALHLTMCGSPRLYEGAGQSHFLDWALQLRRAIEQLRPPVLAVRGAAVE